MIQQEVDDLEAVVASHSMMQGRVAPNAHPVGVGSQAFQYCPYAITTQMYLDLIYLRTQTPRTEHSSTKVRVYESLHLNPMDCLSPSCFQRPGATKQKGEKRET
jgi:hypothetical protein